MSNICMPDCLKTIAFGGVAMGVMKAKEQEAVAGTIKNRGFNFILKACPKASDSRLIRTKVVKVH